MKWALLIFILLYGGRANADNNIAYFEARYNKLSLSNRLLESSILLPELQAFIDIEKENKKKVQAYIIKSKIYLQYEAYLESMESLNKAVKLMNDLDPFIQSEVKIGQAKVQFFLDRFHQSIETIDANSDVLRLHNPSSYAKALILKGKALFKLGSFHKALNEFELVKSLIPSPSECFSIASMYIAQTALAQGNLVLAENSIDELNDSAINLLAEEQKLELQVIKLQLLMQKGNFKLTTLAAKKLLKYTLDTRFLNLQIKLQDILAKSYLQIGDYKSAFTYMQRHNLTTSALASKKRENKLLQLEAINNSEKKKQRIRLLEKESELARIQFEKKTIMQSNLQREHQLRIRKWIFFSLLSVVFLCIAYYIWHRRKITTDLKFLVGERTKELELKTKMLEKLSHTDSLTGLYNRHYLNSIIKNEIASVQRKFFSDNNPNNSLCFMIIDIDYFKEINDTFGHIAGDKVLKDFSDVLKSNVRDSDYVIRWGGEEFLVILRDCTMSLASNIAENIRNSIRSKNIYIDSTEQVNISVSTGFAPYPFISSEPTLYNWEDVIEISDFALYTAKNNQRDAWIGFEPSSSLLNSPSNLNSITQAVRNKQILVTTSIEKELTFLSS